jgi:hypothetical protein
VDRAALAVDRAALAAYWAALASGDPEKAWAHFDPCGLLAKLVEVGLMGNPECGYIKTSDLWVEALAVAITDGEHAYSSLTEDQVQQLRDLLLAIRPDNIR